MSTVQDANTTVVSGFHPLDVALRMTPQHDGSMQATAPAAYWNMVGPYGGITAAQMLQAVLAQPNLLGEPVSITVNFAGPVASGDMRIEAVAVRTNRSTQHWTVSMGQRNAEGEYEICTTATVITAVRRETFSMDSLDPPAMPDPATCERYDTQGAMEWLHRYDMRVVQGAIPTVWDDSGQESISQLWVRDDPPRPLDFPALAALCDVFFPRIWLQRARRVPAGTVGMTVYFHAGSEQLAQQADRHVLAQASAQAFRNGYFDQTAQLWDAEGSLLATSHQIVYYKE
ncbi:acyl-CoA thioesterase [Comamonas kerstersii]|uniref:Acyl-CoA thioesterase n=1 Tax=Comamonas kerstersii TaxID=225992 RepID=A0A0W7Z3A6_9BURK|nr:thioesterase family protein [Comamonas kerstersii]AQZ97416.1 acyl-CoA thioesterase [Comamonas kerstersii]KAB0584848.1 thioesterase family protein [Comamonas kerstersii]KUF41680.1 acyl-CoA thioesterase [Comamonas kerstersii]HBW62120.1 thioesterase family protein [Comamonas kerstersii]